MSGVALGWAWRQDVPDTLAKLVLVKLADQANDDGESWPSRRSLAHDCGVTARTVTNKIAQLRDLGLVTVESRARENGGRTSNLYRLPLSTPPWNQGSTPPGTVVPPQEEPPLEPGENLTVLSAAKPSPSNGKPPKPRKRDPIWDTLVELFGAEAAGLERGRWNAACKSLRESGATPESLRAAARSYRERFSDEITMTPTALAANWTILNGPPPRAGPKVTGWRLVRGSHGTTLIEDSEGRDRPPR